MGRAYLLLSVFGPVAGLVLARRFDLGVAATAVPVLLGLAPAYLAWAAFRADRAEAGSVDLDEVLEQLAVAVKNQWDSEEAVRRVNDPYPLPVAWQDADHRLGEPWPLLADLARAWPGGPPGDPALWPPDADGLAGRDAEIGRVFSERVPTRRLVILGEPGAGKSVLLIRLLQDLIARRAAGDAVPVLFSLASWDFRHPLKAWMADQLRRAHPGLAAAAPSTVALTDAAVSGPSDLAAYLLNAGRILPLFDGFDELPPARHAMALDLLNRALPARQPLALTSRTGPYRAALTGQDTTVCLNGTAVIQLRPLDAQAAADYLRRDAGGPHAPAAARWDTVVTHLGTSSPVGQALATPLGLFLARTIYNPRPGTPAGSPPAPHPDELCHAAAYLDRAAIDSHLFQALIPAAYTSYQPDPPRWTTQQAHHTFVFLAAFLQNQRAGSPDLAWWELPAAIPRPIRRLVSGLVFGLEAGLAVGLAFGPALGLASGLVFGLAFGLASGLASGRAFGLADSATPGIRLRLSPPRLVSGLVSGLGLGLAIGLALGLALGLAFGLVGGLAAGLVGGLAAGLAAGLMFGLKTDPPI